MLIDARSRFGCRHQWTPGAPRRDHALVCIRCGQTVDELDIVPRSGSARLVRFSVPALVASPAGWPLADAPSSASPDAA